MADLKISELPAAAALTGTELVPAVQGGDTVRTTAQAIADLAAGGAAPKIAYARILADGSIPIGVGIASCTILFGGQYEITFDADYFSAAPVVVATAGFSNLGSGAPTVVNHANVEFQTEDAARLYVYDSTGSLTTTEVLTVFAVGVG